MGCTYSTQGRYNLRQIQLITPQLPSWEIQLTNPGYLTLQMAIRIAYHRALA